MAPTVPEKVFLEHWMPGRARLRVPKPRSPRRVRRVAGRAGRMRRVEQVTANAATGSLLLTFSPDDPIDLLIDDMRIAGLDIISPPPPKWPTLQTQSTGAAIVRQVMGMANAKLHIATRGRVDLRLVVPAFYVLLAARNFRSRAGRLRNAPWYQLAWWAFDSFFKLHEDVRSPAGAGPRDRIVD